MSVGGGAAAALFPITLGILILIGGLLILIFNGRGNKTKQKVKIKANGTCTKCVEARRSGFKSCPYCGNNF